MILSLPTARAAQLLAPGAMMLSLLLSGCAGTAPASLSPPQPGSKAGRPAVIDVALSLNGAPYRMGGETPATGFDCSGFVHYVYGTQGVQLPRRAAAMARALPRVPVRDMRPGDLLFFNTTGHPYSHVGLYLGDGRFIHAPSRRTGHVRISDLHRAYWRKRLDGVRRPSSPHSLARRD